MRTAVRIMPAGAALLVAGSLAAQEPSPQEMQEMMGRWQEAMTPGAQHEMLQRMVGDWTISVTVWQMGPAPVQMEGSASVRPILGGRFVVEEIESSMMGMPLETMTLYGYDNFRSMFTLTHFDNLATAMQTGQGSLDQSGNVVTYFGTMDEPMTGERGKTAKFVVRFVDADTRMFELHDLHIVPGQTKVMEVTYRRRQ